MRTWSQTVPGSPTDANTILGYACIGFGPKNIDQAKKIGGPVRAQAQGRACFNTTGQFGRKINKFPSKKKK